MVTRPFSKAMFTTPTSPNANFWHRKQCQIIPKFCLSLGKKGMVCAVPCLVRCFLPPHWKGPQPLRCNLRTFPAGPSGSLPHHRPSASGSPPSQGKPGALTCLKHFGLPRTPSSAPEEINKNVVSSNSGSGLSQLLKRAKY